MDHASDISSYIQLLMTSQHFHLLLVQGPPGWGKSSLTRRALDSLQVPFRELGAYATPLGLFNGLVENDCELLVIDDCAGLFHNPLSMSILNAATWPTRENGPRTIRWTSTTELAKAEAVNFQGKIIVLTNSLPGTPQAQAFASRALLYRLHIDRHNIAEHRQKAARSIDHFPNQELAIKVAGFLSEQSQHHGADRISLRTLRLGYELATVNSERWQTLLLRALPQVTMDPKQIVLDLGASGLKVEEQAAAFASQTGLSRRRFFYFRDELGLRERGTAQRSEGGAPIRRGRSRQARPEPEILSDLQYVPEPTQ